MKKGLVLFLFFISGVVFSQIKSNQTYYFFSIAYGQNNEVFVTDVYEANINNRDIYGKLADRYTKFQNYLLKNGSITSLKEIQTGYEKNYQKKEQAIAEQQYFLSTLEKQKFTAKMIQYSL
ncbi:hypothetical protein [Empedobacter tilapiae]|uniref:Uncharacterized protein n=1 Tax=Empedobacter tilapiae TaxID=2491114 RepID=A0A4Z1B743_9FLAO|nr:hypothetical protein [Empedobacter tilapiae]TGN26298.1 hypothetical protein E4J94_10720 [Empedobacter tilapiae]